MEVHHTVQVSKTKSITNTHDKSLFVCFPVVDCGLLSVPVGSLGGLMVTFSSTVFNNTATYSCPELGHQLVGTAERICEANGNWSNTAPHCESEALYHSL